MRIDDSDSKNSTDGAWETRSAAWDEGYRHSLDYAKEHGTARVAAAYRTPDGFRLGGWIAEQRSGFSRGTMTPEREQLLQELPGWLWDARLAAWDEGLSTSYRLHLRTR